MLVHFAPAGAHVQDSQKSFFSTSHSSITIAPSQTQTDRPSHSKPKASSLHACATEHSCLLRPSRAITKSFFLLVFDAPAHAVQQRGLQHALIELRVLAQQRKA